MSRWEEPARLDPDKDPELTDSSSAWSFIDPSVWRTEPPPRQWVWEGYLPRGCVTGLSGPGGAGKTGLSQQLATHVATGIPMYGYEVDQGVAFVISCEESEKELWRRQWAINRYLGIRPEDLSGKLYLKSMLGDPNSILCDVHERRIVRSKAWGDMMAGIKEKAAGNPVSLIVLDLAVDFWTGNEIDRQQVNAYVKHHLAAIADEFRCAVMVLSHPSMAGLQSGSGTSGSTAWDGSYRSRLYLNHEKGQEIRTLERKKSNYEKEESEGLKVIWDKGYYAEVREPSREEIDAQLREEAVREGQLNLRAVWEEVGKRAQEFPTKTLLRDCGTIIAGGNKLSARAIPTLINLLIEQEHLDVRPLPKDKAHGGKKDYLVQQGKGPDV